MSIAVSSSAAVKLGDLMPPAESISEFSLYRLIEVKARQTPDAVAIAAPGRKPLTYRGLCRLVEETVQYLNSIGIGRRDCVAAVLPDGPESAVAFLGIAAGAACAPLNPRYRASEFELCLSALGAKALITASDSGSPAVTVARRLGIMVINLSLVLEAAAGSFALKG